MVPAPVSKTGKASALRFNSSTFLFSEAWPSGLRHHTANVASVKRSRVQIPPLPFLLSPIHPVQPTAAHDGSHAAATSIFREGDRPTLANVREFPIQLV